MMVITSKNMKHIIYHVVAKKMEIIDEPLKEENEVIDVAIARAVEAIKEACKTNFEKSMSKYN